MTKEEVAAIYANKQFFLVRPNGHLEGPRKDIFFVHTYPLPTEAGYLYIQARKQGPLFLRPDEVFVKEG